MDKIPRSAWIPLTDRKPEDGAICLVTDGKDVAVATFDAHSTIYPWDPVAVQGYEWDFTMYPTHWMALSVELPQTE